MTIFDNENKGQCYIFDHPVIHHKLTLMREAETSSEMFRTLLHQITQLMMYEVSRNYQCAERKVTTPISKCEGKILNEKVCVVPILRAGLGMLDGVLSLLPESIVGHIGLARNEETLKPQEYYCKLPELSSVSRLLLLDPMLATGGSANFAIQLLKSKGAKSIQLMSLLAVNEGIESVQNTHPDVDLFIAAVDPKLNENGFIIPGLGDAGDRLFNL